LSAAVLSLPPTRPRSDLYSVGEDGVPVLHLHPGQLRAFDSPKRFVGVFAGTQSGKALSLATPIPTPSGFRLMADIQAGDEVFDETGAVRRVTGVSPVYDDHPCYVVIFDDGTKIIADAEHRWLTSTYKERKNAARRVPPSAHKRVNLAPQSIPGPDSGVRTTAEIRGTLRDGRGGSNHAVRLAGPVDFPARDLPVNPYSFGVWLGDGTQGTANLTCAEPEVLAEIIADGYGVGPARESNSGKARTYTVGYTGPRGGDPGSREPNRFLEGLRACGSLSDKSVPEVYLIASRPQRLAFLQGLMDTDGWYEKGGECCFANKRVWITQAVNRLAKSLGLKTRTWSRPTASGETSYCVSFYSKTPVFRVRRKLDRQADWKRRPLGNSKCDYRYVVDVQPYPSVPVKCISVDSPSRLYLAGESCVPTHNTSFGPWWLWNEIEKRKAGDYLAVTASYDLFKLKMLPALREVFEGVMKCGRYWAGDRVIEIMDPVTEKFLARKATDPMYARIILRSAESGGGLESTTGKAAWIDEAGQDVFTAETWRAVLRRLSLSLGRALLTTTIYNFGWLKQEFYDRWVNGEPDYDVIQFDSTENPLFPREEWERAQASMPEWQFNMQYRGLFERPAGLIYDSLGDAPAGPPGFGNLVARFPVPVHWPRYLGLDFGGVNTGGFFVAYNPDSARLYAYRDYLAGHLTAAGHARELLKGEPAVPTCVGGSFSEGQWRDEFTAAGLPVYRPDVSEVEIGIARTYAAIKTRRLLLMNDLAGTLREFRNYSRKLDAAGKPTLVIVDKNRFHRLDAARYVVGWLQQPSGGTELRSASAAGPGKPWGSA
jgi:hypothetical protein